MGGQRAELKVYSQRESAQGESWTTALNLTKLAQKPALQKNTSPLIRKSYSLFLGEMVKEVVAEDDDK
jgi:hypothetical protein